jgi:benzoyl-CoA reductase/2-hydroxyglutaryl-CoA dehydratase subunit BcrC/BadD/HgdB
MSIDPTSKTHAPNLPARADVMRRMREDGRRIIAALPFHYPHALLRACGFHPMEIWGPPHVTAVLDDEHFQEYACSIVRNATQFLKTDLAGRVDAILIPHTCDSLQGMASVLQGFATTAPVLTLYLPRGRRNSDVEFAHAELVSLARRLSGISGITPSAEELHAAIDLEDRAMAAFSDAAANRRDYAIGDREFFSALRTREYLPPDEFIALVARLPVRDAPDERPGVFLSGIVPEPMSLFDLLNDNGVIVVGDDLACGSRRIYAPCKDEDPVRRLARQMLSMAPEPTISPAVADRNAHILARLSQTGARGLLVYDVKFCEPEAFYVPLLEQASKAAGIPCLHLEVELDTHLPGQVQTRIGAFLEVIR